MVELTSVAAVADNGVIGRNGELPWPSIPADRRQYRKRIADAPVILGRITFESMLADLPGSAQIVLSRSASDFDIDTVYHATGVNEAIEAVESLGAERAYVIGGAGIYDLFQPQINRMVLSRVHGEYEGDAYFPEWDTDAWDLVDTEEHDRFSFELWERKEESVAQ